MNIPYLEMAPIYILGSNRIVKWKHIMKSFKLIPLASIFFKWPLQLKHSSLQILCELNRSMQFTPDNQTNPRFRTAGISSFNSPFTQLDMLLLVKNAYSFTFLFFSFLSRTFCKTLGYNILSLVYSQQMKSNKNDSCIAPKTVKSSETPQGAQCDLQPA